jgi:hypothetical protein
MWSSFETNWRTFVETSGLILKQKFNLIEVADVSENAVFEIKPELALLEKRTANEKAYLQLKVDSARLSMRAGDSLTHDEVESEFAARRRLAAIQMAHTPRPFLNNTSN